MNILPKLAILGMLICISSGTHAAAKFYVRPSVQYAKIYLDDNLVSSGKLGAGIAAGCALGSSQSFNLELEATFTPGLDAHRVKAYSGYIQTLHETLDVNQFQFSFKYVFPPKDSVVRILVGPVAGVWTAKGNDVISTTYTYSSSVPPVARYNFSESGILLGPVVGGIIKVNDHAQMEVAYRQLYMIGSDDSGSYGPGLVGHITRQFYVSFKYLF